MRKPYRKTPTWRTLCSTMNKIALAVLIVSVAAASSIAKLAAQKHVQKSTVYDWDAGTKANDWGAVRQVMRSPTPTLDELEIHISSLEAGQPPTASQQA